MSHADDHSSSGGANSVEGKVVEQKVAHEEKNVVRHGNFPSSEEEEQY